jgi:hypothetical protein
LTPWLLRTRRIAALPSTRSPSPTRWRGYLLSDGRETGRADIVLAAIVLLAVLGKLSDSLMLALERRMLAWRDSYIR